MVVPVSTKNCYGKAIADFHCQAITHARRTSFIHGQARGILPFGLIKDLLLSNQINKALLKIGQMIRNPYDLEGKDNLTKLSTYISRNRLGITNHFKLKDKNIERAGVIESNINKVIAARFKKKGMS